MTTATEEISSAPEVAEFEVLDAPAKIAVFDPIEAGLNLLREEAKKTVYDIATTAGVKAAKEFRARCVKTRTAAKEAYDGWNKPILEQQRAARETLAYIIEEVEKIEDPVDEQIKAEEKRKAEEKAERERKEKEARDAIEARIDSMKGYPLKAVGLASAAVAALIYELTGVEVTIDDFGDRGGTAMLARESSLAALESLRAAAAQREEADRIRKDAEAEVERQQAELKQKQADLAEQVRIAAETAAETERLAKVAREEADAKRKQEDDARQAEIKRQQDEIDRQRKELEDAKEETARKERERIEAETAEANKKKEAEIFAAKVLADWTEAEQEDLQRTADAIAARQREEEAAERLRQTLEDQQRERDQFALIGPGDAAIVAVLAQHYRVPPANVVGWLAKFDFAIEIAEGAPL